MYQPAFFKRPSWYALCLWPTGVFKKGKETKSIFPFSLGPRPAELRLYCIALPLLLFPTSLSLLRPRRRLQHCLSVFFSLSTDDDLASFFPSPPRNFPPPSATGDRGRGMIYEGGFYTLSAGMPPPPPLPT